MARNFDYTRNIHSIPYGQKGHLRFTCETVERPLKTICVKAESNNYLANEVFPKCSGTFIEFSDFNEKLVRHCWVQFKDSLCCQCLPGTVVACWFPTQEIAGSNTPFLQKVFYKFCRFFRIHLGKTLIL